MKPEDVERLEKSIGQIEGFHKEVSALARKSPNDALNKFKLKVINAALTDANMVLGDAYRPVVGFECFDVDDVPTNSDATLILSQFIEELERKRTDSIRQEHGYWYYVTSPVSKIRTAPPRKLTEKRS